MSMTDLYRVLVLFIAVRVLYLCQLIGLYWRHVAAPACCSVFNLWWLWWRITILMLRCRWVGSSLNSVYGFI